MLLTFYSKCAWFIPLKDKKGIINTNASQKILDESYHKQTKYGQIKAANFKIDQ